jgi:hypothetical protein
MKELRLKIEKYNKAIVFQTLKMSGEFEDTEHVKFMSHPAIIRNEILLDKYPNETAVGIKYFNDNDERDEVFDNIIKWISDEQFSVPRRELIIGKEAMFNDSLGAGLVRKKLIHILPEGFESRYISESDTYPYWTYWKYAYPAQEVLKIKGNVYHWKRP